MGQQPARHIPAVDVEDHVQVEPGPLGRAEQLGDVPGVDLVGLGGQQLGLGGRRVGRLSAALVDLVVVAQHPVHRRHRRQVDTLVQQLGIHRRRCLVDVLWSVEDPVQLGALGRRQRPWLGRRCPLGPRRRWALAVAAIPARLRFADGRTCATHAHQRLQLCDGLVDHLVSPCWGSVTLSVASCSNSAESFPWTSITLRALASSA